MENKKHITCTVEFSEGAIDRITSAFVDLYYSIQDGVYADPKHTDKTA